jgi:Do/DeqQ family serine protease
VASYADIVDKVLPSVVTIRTEGKASPRMTSLPQDFPFPELFGQRGRGGRAPQQVQRSLGSGVVVSGDGYILTNHHVIADASRIQVELADKRTFDATLIGSDQPSDLAVVRIDTKAVPALPVGDSSAMRVGDVVMAVGNPLGVGQTVTMGIISAKGRATGIGDGSFEDFLQTDAAINQGNSGGALVNLRGELVGINSQILSPSGGNIGIGFAVPSNMAKNVMEQLISGGTVHRGKLGVTVQGVSGDLAAGLGLDAARGALVSDVTDGGPAARAGVKRGDVIVAYQGRPVADPNGIRNEIAATKPGSTVTLQVLRNGRTEDLKATLDELTIAKSDDERDAPESGHGRFGMTVQPITPQVARELDLPRGKVGVVVTDIDPSGQAASAGLREGDLISEVNGKPVNSPADLKATLDRATDRPAVLLVEREGQAVYVPLRAPRS